MKKMVYAVLALMALSFNVFANEPKTLNFCTGAAEGYYSQIGQVVGTEIQSNSKGLVVVKFVNTKGSVDSATRLKAGECDIAILQNDAVTSRPMPTDISTTDAHQEAIFWIHSKNSKVKDFDDLSDSDYKNLGVAIVDGSGAEVTLRNFGNIDKDFKDLNIVGFKNWRWAAKAAAEGKVRKGGIDIPIAGLIYVGRQGKISTEITGEFKEELRIGEIDVSAFKKVKDLNGNPLYTTCEVVQANGIETSTTLKPDTYCLRAQFVYNNAFFEGMDENDAELLQTVVDKAIVRNVRQQQAAK